MPFKLRPLADRVIVEQDKAEVKTKGGIILSEAHGEKPLKGKVLAVGPGKYLESAVAQQTVQSVDELFVPMSLKVNDIVYFAQFSPMHIELDNREFLVIREGDILCVEEPDVKSPIAKEKK